MRRCAHEVPTVYILRVKKHIVEKKVKEKLSYNSFQATCTSSYHEKQAHEKFHNDKYKTVRGLRPQEVPTVHMSRLKND